MLLLTSAGFFFKINFFQSVLIWVKTACIGYQLKTVGIASRKERVERICTTIRWGEGLDFDVYLNLLPYFWNASTVDAGENVWLYRFVTVIALVVFLKIMSTDNEDFSQVITEKGLSLHFGSRRTSLLHMYDEVVTCKQSTEALPGGTCSLVPLK